MSEPLALWPRDRWNDALLESAHPPAWRNPTPAARYDLVVLGGGTAGLVSAIVSVGLGARVALVSREPRPAAPALDSSAPEIVAAVREFQRGFGAEMRRVHEDLAAIKASIAALEIELPRRAAARRPRPRATTNGRRFDRRPSRGA